MNTRSIAMTCFALAVFLFCLAILTLGSGVGPANDLFRVAIVVSPILAAVTGLYLLRKSPSYF